MTVSNTSFRGDYTENGVTTSFPIPFYFLDNSHVLVIGTVAGTAATLVLGSDYTVAGAGVAGGGTLTILTPTNGRVLTVIRDVPFTQLTHYVENDPFPAASHERALDLLTMQNQQQQETLNRAAVLPSSTTPPGTAPTPVEGSVLGWVSGKWAWLTGATVSLAANLLTLARGYGADLVGYLAPYTGATGRLLYLKLAETVSVGDWASLATAVAGIGSAKVTLQINTNVTVSADLTIPSNISLAVSGGGLITVASGKRLTINGHFSAPRLQQVFAATLHTASITGSVSGNKLTITATASGVPALGHVVNGIAGAPAGTMLGGAGTYNGSTGTFYLNNPLDLIASQAITTEGPSVIFGVGAVEHVYPQWFGAIADDGTTDNLVPLKLAVYSMPWGGRVRIPAGKYKSSGPVALHAGITIEGDSQADRWQGSPANEVIESAFIWLSSNSTSLWIWGGGQSNIRIRNLGMAASSNPNQTPASAGKVGILMTGHFPAFVWGGGLDGCQFYNLDNGINVTDSWAGNATYRPDPAASPATTATYYDWSIAPLTPRECSFNYCAVGISFNTNNADNWNIQDCQFNIPTGGAAVYLIRCGMFKMSNCFGGGASVNTNAFLTIAANGAGSLDQIILDNCQAETLAHSIYFLTSSSNTWATPIITRNCIFQMSADVYLGKMCNYISQGNQYAANLYVDTTVAGVKIESLFDDFGSGYHIIFLGTQDATSFINNYLPGFSPDSNYPYTFLAGRATLYGTAAPASGTWKAGDRLIRNPPLVGSPKAWSCTVAGTPGTWVSEGNL